MAFLRTSIILAGGESASDALSRARGRAREEGASAYGVTLDGVVAYGMALDGVVVPVVGDLPVVPVAVVVVVGAGVVTVLAGVITVVVGVVTVVVGVVTVVC